MPQPHHHQHQHHHRADENRWAAPHQQLPPKRPPPKFSAIMNEYVGACLEDHCTIGRTPVSFPVKVVGRLGVDIGRAERLFGF